MPKAHSQFSLSDFEGRAPLIGADKLLKLRTCLAETENALRWQAPKIWREANMMQSWKCQLIKKCGNCDRECRVAARRIAYEQKEKSSGNRWGTFKV